MFMYMNKYCTLFNLIRTNSHIEEWKSSKKEGEHLLLPLDDELGKNSVHSTNITLEAAEDGMKSSQSLDLRSYNITEAMRKEFESGKFGVKGHPAHHPIDAYLLIKRRSVQHKEIVRSLELLVQSITCRYY